MPKMGNFPVFPATIDVTLGQFFLQSGNEDAAKGILNILGNVDTSNFAAAAVQVLSERLVQFSPFAGAGGHSHDGTVSAPLANSMVKTRHLNRERVTMIYTGSGKQADIYGKYVFNMGTKSILVTTAAVGGTFGTAALDVRAHGDYVIAAGTNRNVVVVAQARGMQAPHQVLWQPNLATPGLGTLVLHAPVALSGQTFSVDWFAIFEKLT